jgi:hypothetical protein
LLFGAGCSNHLYKQHCGEYLLILSSVTHGGRGRRGTEHHSWLLSSFSLLLTVTDVPEATVTVIQLTCDIQTAQNLLIVNLQTMKAAS